MFSCSIRKAFLSITSATPSGRARKPSINPVRQAPGIPNPGPPSGPAPASQPRGYRPSVRVHRQKSIGQVRQIAYISSQKRIQGDMGLNPLQDPPQQPNLDIVAQLKQTAAKKNPSFMRRQESVRESRISANEDFLKTPQGGFAQNARESIRGVCEIEGLKSCAASHQVTDVY